MRAAACALRSSCAARASFLSAATCAACFERRAACSLERNFNAYGLTTYRFARPTAAKGIVNVAAATIGVALGAIKTGNWNLCPEWLNRSFTCTPLIPTLTDRPSAVSRFILRVHPMSKSIAVVPTRTPSRKVDFFERRRAMNPATPVDAGPTEKSAFQLVFPFARCAPVVRPPTGPTFHVR